MTETFAVEQIELDLPPLAAAFSRRLHAAGLPATPVRSADFARALDLTRPVSRTRLYWTARAVFVADRLQVPAFDAVFAEVFGSDARERSAAQPDAPPPAPDAPEQGDDGAAAEDGAGVSRSDEEVDAVEETDEDAADGEEDEFGVFASADEQLRGRSFDTLEPWELAQLYRLMSRLRLMTPTRRTRRYVKGRHGGAVDMRRTLRASLRTAGDPIRLARRRRRIARRRLVMLCDISGSMEPYARAYLQLLTCARGSGPDAEVFVFATRLTRLTRALAARNPEHAIRRAAAAAPDWSSGTRIGEALKLFNDRHGRRGMARGAVIVILSDGWERGDPALVGREMQRLRRLAQRIVWVNPRVSARGFSVQAGGMLAALPHCDALVSGHSYDALAEVADAIAVESGSRRGSAAADGRPPAAVSEAWPSATPEAGSSVAMPSGFGPARGHTTPGWSPPGYEP